MNVQEYEAREELAENENSHVFHMWSPLHAKIDENYTFVKRGYLFTILSTILYVIIYPILFVFNKVAFGFSIEGEKNVEGIQAGKITVSNHVHPMDCTMNAIINAPRKTYFPTLKSNMDTNSRWSRSKEKVCKSDKRTITGRENSTLLSRGISLAILYKIKKV